VNDRAATFTMALCARNARKRWRSRGILRVVPEGRRAPDRLAGGLDGGAARDLGSYAYAADLRKVDQSGALEQGMTLEYLTAAGACVLGTPEECLATCERYRAAGVDLLLCS